MKEESERERKKKEGKMDQISHSGTVASPTLGPLFSWRSSYSCMAPSQSDTCA